ncbi:curli-like amyloid fiber formation chaperone CsgH [Sulfitobacter sp. S45]|uniref:curli-like amyloid fiber formation chaperone CsgH n=1 Tax=Sulfitobacter sp. S45 TaxID=3368581 RepID=UPI003744F481
MLGPVILSLVPLQVESSTALDCAISLVRHDNTIEVTGILKGKPGQSGWYSMDTLSRSGSSKSLSRQSGKFHIDADGEVILGRSMVGISVGTTMAVEIVGESEQTQESFDCRAHT